MKRRDVLTLGLLAASLTAATPALAQAPYPNRPVRLVIPSVPAGVHDVIGRLWAERVKPQFGTIVIDNRGGGGGSIGANDVAHSQPDGYSILLGSTSSHVLVPASMANPPYDPIKDFSAVTVFAYSSTSIVVHPATPARTLMELVAYAKANPGKLYNGSGVASPPHIAWGLFVLTTGTDITFVPYRGMAQAMTDLVSGQIHMMIDGIGSLLPHIRDGKARALAVTGTTRSPDLPDVPTMIESGYPDYVLSFWTGILAPAGTPAEFVAKVNAAVNQGLKSPEMKQSLAKFNVEPNVASPQEFSTFLAAEARKWGDVVKATNIKVE